MTLVKLCGLMSPADAAMAADAGADMAGMVMSQGFRRSVTSEEAAIMARAVEGTAVPVGVFVDEPMDSIVMKVRKAGLGMVQLHGSEDASYIEHLKGELGIPVVKSFRPDRAGRDEIESSPADLVLLDPGAGTGTAFDWSSLAGIRRRFILAGGLTPGNVASAVSAMHPYAVDVSSGIETDGRKDKDKMKAFVAAVREQDSKEV